MLPERFTPEFIRNIEQLRIRSRRSFLGSKQGGHLSLKRGHGIEFADYRKYEPGDDPRRIDWGVFGRTDRLYVKRFREEEDMSVLILLDTSPSMCVPAIDGKWEMARDVALTLSYVALMQQDTVTVSALGAFHSPRYYGAKAVHELSNRLLSLKLDQNRFSYEQLAREVQMAVSRIRFPGKALFISDFLMPIGEIRRAVNILRARNLEITAIQVLSPSDFEPLKNLDQAIALDSETGEEVELVLDADTRAQYSELLKDHNAELLEYFAQSQISYSLARSDQPLGEYVINSLTEIGLLR